MPRHSTMEDRLHAQVDSFVADIYSIVREAALDAVGGALADGSAARPHRVARGVKKRSKKGRSARRVRRSSEDLAKLGGQLVGHIRSNPGERLEEIGSALGIATSELKRPIQILLAAKKLRTEGERRGTRYFAGRSAARKAAKRKVAKKKASKTPRRKKVSKKAA